VSEQNGAKSRKALIGSKTAYLSNLKLLSLGLNDNCTLCLVRFLYGNLLPKNHLRPPRLGKDSALRLSQPFIRALAYQMTIAALDHLILLAMLCGSPDSAA
jgi:hypothetical protein